MKRGQHLLAVVGVLATFVDRLVDGRRRAAICFDSVSSSNFSCAASLAACASSNRLLEAKSRASSRALSMSISSRRPRIRSCNRLSSVTAESGSGGLNASASARSRAILCSLGSLNSCNAFALLSSTTVLAATAASCFLMASFKATFSRFASTIDVSRSISAVSVASFANNRAASPGRSATRLDLRREQNSKGINDDPRLRWNTLSFCSVVEGNATSSIEGSAVLSNDGSGRQATVRSARVAIPRTTIRTSTEPSVRGMTIRPVSSRTSCRLPASATGDKRNRPTSAVNDVLRYSHGGS